MTSIQPVAWGRASFTGAIPCEGRQAGWPAGSDSGPSLALPPPGLQRSSLAQEVLDLHLEQVDGDAVVPAFGKDDVGVALGGLDELQVHGAHALLILADHRVGRAAALVDVALQTADEAHV